MEDDDDFDMNKFKKLRVLNGNNQNNGENGKGNAAPVGNKLKRKMPKVDKERSCVTLQTNNPQEGPSRRTHAFSQKSESHIINQKTVKRPKTLQVGNMTKKYVCGICDTDYILFEELDKHVEQMHHNRKSKPYDLSGSSLEEGGTMRRTTRKDHPLSVLEPEPSISTDFNDATRQNPPRESSARVVPNSNPGGYQSDTSLISDDEHEDASTPVQQLYIVNDCILDAYREKLHQEKEIEFRVKEKVLETITKLFEKRLLETLNYEEKGKISAQLDTKVLETDEGTTIGVFVLRKNGKLSLRFWNQLIGICGECFGIIRRSKDPYCYNCLPKTHYVGRISCKSQKISHTRHVLASLNERNTEEFIRTNLKTKFIVDLRKHGGKTVTEKDRIQIMHIDRFQNVDYPSALAHQIGNNIWEWIKLKFVNNSTDDFLVSRIRILYEFLEEGSKKIGEKMLEAAKKDGYEIRIKQTYQTDDQKMNKQDMSRLGFRPTIQRKGSIRSNKIRHAVYMLFHPNQNSVYYGKLSRADRGGQRQLANHHRIQTNKSSNELMKLHALEPPCSEYAFITKDVDCLEVLESYSQLAVILAQALEINHKSIGQIPKSSNTCLELKSTKVQLKGWEHNPMEVLNIILHNEYNVQVEFREITKHNIDNANHSHILSNVL